MKIYGMVSGIDGEDLFWTARTSDKAISIWDWSTGDESWKRHHG